MEQLLQNVDWMALLTAIWTIVLVPIGKEIYEIAKAKKLDGYAVILYEEVVKAVKAINQSVVDDLKGTDGWDEETKENLKELAKQKATQALSSIALRALKEANTDFDEYLSDLIETAIFDVKNGLK